MHATLHFDVVVVVVVVVSFHSESRFDLRPDCLAIFHLILGGRHSSVVRKPDSPY